MPKKRSYYNPQLKEFARDLRLDGTMGEAILWKKALRSNTLWPYQFNRQYPMLLDGHALIADFICRKLDLIIEIDGYSHQFKHDQDVKRDKLLVQHGFTIIRFKEQEVRKRLDEVITRIDYVIKTLE
jgi:very-short-patch-repair endonuclease